MLREMARESDQHACHIDGNGKAPILGSEASLANFHLGDTLAAPTPDRFGQGMDDIDRESQYLADIADGCAWPIADDGCRQASAITAIFLIDMLNDVFALFMFEVDIDIWRLFAFFADEPFEEQFTFRGIDSSNAETIADSGVGG